MDEDEDQVEEPSKKEIAKSFAVELFKKDIPIAKSMMMRKSMKKTCMMRKRNTVNTKVMTTISKRMNMGTAKMPVL